MVTGLGRSLAAAAAALVLAGLACTALSETSGPTPLPAAAPTSAPGAVLEVENRSGAPICYLYVSPTSSAEWEGAHQRLVPGQPIAPDETRVIAVEPGEYDLLAQDCLRNNLATRFGVRLEQGGALTWTLSPRTVQPAVPPPAAESVSLELTNRSNYEVCALYIAAVGGAGWGNNQLAEGDTVAPGDGYEVYNIPPGLYDIRAEACDGQTFWENAAVDLTRTLEWTLNN